MPIVSSMPPEPGVHLSNVEFEHLALVVSARLAELRRAPGSHALQFGFCRALREAKLQFRASLNWGFDVKRSGKELFYHAEQAVRLLKKIKPTNKVISGISRHTSEIRAVLSR